MAAVTGEAEVLLPSKDLPADMEFLKTFGFKLLNIYPDDDPDVAVMSGHGIKLRLSRQADCAPPTILIKTDDNTMLDKYKEVDIVAPNGSIIKVEARTYKVIRPATQHVFEVSELEDGSSWQVGRAGMQYRDLIASRLGGAMQASHIRIEEAGPVPDMVHFHSIAFQLIYCYAGWVKLLYEDQGPAFILHAGDCVTQPPEIRHRVLECSDMLEVIEIGVPALHMTSMDHDMQLPTQKYRPDREFHGQIFCHHRLSEANLVPGRLQGFQSRDTGVTKATHGLAAVHVSRVQDMDAPVLPVSHDADVLFTFVLSGSMELHVEEHGAHRLHTGQAYVIPPHTKYQISNLAADLELLEVALPGNFETTYHN